jgi:hypothetical protein
LDINPLFSTIGRSFSKPLDTVGKRLVGGRMLIH